MTDFALERLEELNFAGQGPRKPDTETAAAIERALSVLPERARRRARWRTVQQALDTILDAQETILEDWRRARLADVGFPLAAQRN
ncbi:MAG: hypothetical protein ACREQM_22000 [Candidatus Dormibacteraceae bacterium]